MRATCRALPCGARDACTHPTSHCPRRRYRRTQFRRLATRASPLGGPDELARASGLTADEAARAWSACPALAEAPHAAAGLASLRAVFRPHSVAALIRKRPELLAVESLSDWVQFLTGYGLDEDAVWRVLRYSTALLTPPPPGGESSSSSSSSSSSVSAPASTNTPFNAGSAIVWLKGWGWTDDNIASRILPCYPQVLTASPEQLQATVEALRERSFDDGVIRRMLLNFPVLLVQPHGADMLALIARIRRTAHNKYVLSGSYHV